VKKWPALRCCTGAVMRDADSQRSRDEMPVMHDDWAAIDIPAARRQVGRIQQIVDLVALSDGVVFRQPIVGCFLNQLATRMINARSRILVGDDGRG
jgi:hypothetical protein